MIGQKKALRKITMATGVVAMTVGLITGFSIEASATESGEGSSCKNQVSQNWGHCHERYDLPSGKWYYSCKAPQFAETKDCNGINP